MPEDGADSSMLHGSVISSKCVCLVALANVPNISAQLLQELETPPDAQNPESDRVSQARGEDIWNIPVSVLLWHAERAKAHIYIHYIGRRWNVAHLCNGCVSLSCDRDIGFVRLQLLLFLAGEHPASAAGASGDDYLDGSTQIRPFFDCLIDFLDQFFIFYTLRA